ncbi:MAG: hypothetical protein RL215_2038, partial [Planctomycetota bacterium]
MQIARRQFLFSAAALTAASTLPAWTRRAIAAHGAVASERQFEITD